MNLNQLETPALFIDINMMNKNMESMNQMLKGSSLSLRPHYKSHKCASIAHLQMINGAKGMTCAKLSEAIDLADSGIEDILIANQITDEIKIRRLADLARLCHLTVCVDDKHNIKKLSEAAKNAGTTIHCLVEYEIGMQRCGVATKEEVLELAREIIKSENLTFDGLQAYAGHISHEENFEERKRITQENHRKIEELIEFLKAENIDVGIISGGSTGSAQLKKELGLYNELQAGSYLFMDATYNNLDLPFENSLFIQTTVVSNRNGLTVVDAGVKTCGVDQGMPKILGNRAKEIVASEEHFQLHDLEHPANPGDKIILVPGHCCSTVNLYDRIYVVSDGKVIDRIQVSARGFGK